MECVTDQVASSHSRLGRTNSVEEGNLGSYFLGERRLMIEEDVAMAGTISFV